MAIKSNASLLRCICFLFSLLAVQGGSPAHAAVTGEIPSGLPPARYEQMVKKSPFALATAVAPVAVTPSFAVNLYLTGVAKIGNDDFVSISSRDQQQGKISLLSGESNKDGISLVSVDWSEQLGKSKVTIKKGMEFAVLEFDQAAMQNTASQPPQLPPTPMGQPPGAGRRIILPSQPGQTNPNYQRPPQVVGQPPGSLPPATRARQRIINAPPPGNP